MSEPPYPRLTEVPDSLSQAAALLSQKIGIELTAYVCGFSHVADVRLIMNGQLATPLCERKIKLALEIAQFICPGMAISWLMGMNTHFDDQAPAKLIRDAGELEIETLELEMRAAATAFESP